MGKTVEQIYKKKSQHEHVLTRPDMYIGSIEPITDDIWVYDEADHVMKQRKATWTPGLYKIFDEILVNAADNKVRDPTGQTTIKVWIDAHRVRVYNNGEGIPVQKHREHDLWVPEMIFGHLLTSSNYDDEEAKVTGGRNGYGAKLTNVFSTRFEVETVHGKSRRKFFMRWRDNMLHHDEPVITPCEGGADYTMVTFYPDFARFHLTEFSEDMILLMKRRVYDIAGCTDKSLKCYLNGERIAIATFAEYVDLYPTMGEERHRASYARVNARWELCVRVSNVGFQQVSFVNAICTSRGGTHVRYILDQLIARVTEAALKKSKMEVKAHMIRPHIFLFINCLIENPGFDSQTKETLTTVRGKFGSVCDVPNSMIDYVLRSGIVERAVEMANSKLTREIASKLRTSDRKQILGIPKLDDANEAGGRNGHRCTLILTEGDSAKTLCTAGLAVKDRDYFGVFPLRGKPLNVRDASLKKMMSCEEIQAVMKIMGLDLRQKYTSTEALRYGHLMIMADQDHDGSHIKGLIINFIHYYWPDLLTVPGFLQQFITPIVKAWRKGRGRDEKALSFFSMPDYFEWKQAMGENLRNYEIRYYKGLGTSGAKEGREYFENIERHRIDFAQRSSADADRIAMAFAKDRVEERKEWITHFKTNTNVNATMDYSVRSVTYSDFVDKELILFSVADCERSIPSVVDGFKPGQRKILFSAFKRNLTKSIKVMQLAGYVSEHSAYHHGEQSLVQTIVAMAQDFVGSNNLPLLQQDGQFGTRLQGGKDHAAGRYIFTRLAQLTRFVFHPADDYVVDYRDDDGLSVEPFYYVPVLPMVLVNGTSGIGTGFSTNIPSYNPIEIIDNLLRLMRGEALVAMRPWYFAFTGVIEEREKGKFISRGRYTVRPDGVVSITELPVNVWTQNYKRFLEELREKEVVVQYREHNTDVTVDFDVYVHPQVLQQWVAQDVVEEKLQLREYIHATNIIAFNREGQITKYLDAEAVLREFYLVRLDYYAKRKDYLLGELRRMTSKLENMVRFIREVIAGTLVITRRRKRDVLDELRRRRYVAFPPHSSKKVSATTIDANNGNDDDDGDGDGDEHGDGDHSHNSGSRSAVAANAARRRNTGAAHGSEAHEEMLLLGGMLSARGTVTAAQSAETAEEQDSPEVQRASRDYDYLLGMKLWSLTAEMVARLEGQLQRAKDETAAMEQRSPKDLWAADLHELRPRLIAYFIAREKEIAAIQRKKAEKKRPFDVRRLRVPILSDKARQLLHKEATDKARSAAARGHAATTAAAAGSVSGGAATAAALAAAEADEDKTPMAKMAMQQQQQPPLKRRRARRRRDSDDDDDDMLSLSDDEDDDWLDSDSDSHTTGGGGRGRGGGGGGRSAASRRSNSNSNKKEEGSSSPPRRRSPSPSASSSTARRTQRGKATTTTTRAPRKRVKAEDKPTTTTAAVTSHDDFDLDGFGLDALTSNNNNNNSNSAGKRRSVSPPSRPRSSPSRSRAANEATAGGRRSSSKKENDVDDEDDDLRLLGLDKRRASPPRSPARAAASRSRSASPPQRGGGRSSSNNRGTKSTSNSGSRGRTAAATRSRSRSNSGGGGRRSPRATTTTTTRRRTTATAAAAAAAAAKPRTTGARTTTAPRRRRRRGSSSDSSSDESVVTSSTSSSSSRSSSSSSISSRLSDMSD